MKSQTTPILLELPSELRGERILVRPFQAGDGAAVWEAVEESRAHLSPWLPWVGSYKVPADAEVFARKAQTRWLTREDLTLSVWEQATGRLLGGTGLHRIQWEIPAFEIGYWLRVSAEGSGYMTEAVRLLCQFTFETLKANRVEIRCDARNTRSAAIPRRLGFIHEATLRNSSRDTAGDLRDTFIFALLPQDYSSLQRK